ncbi:hypothetical protein BJ684DRAFT_14362 [Piptocephalis cylindrospora]|uniref:Uncharacterized protein n=1 Tax=Piptocephalis cylindrospora TaxID=1907219 RepID=A0A4P9YA85_9FUNG|nr:hypothetical protein BJ684DRAFT_14362 [Piptocephalis cylindrospora]|eukprot:RKP15381.1 hypothetical protein BJ684DRAFT_14362 [Piptocephalis cylindrospora]
MANPVMMLSNVQAAPTLSTSVSVGASRIPPPSPVRPIGLLLSFSGSFGSQGPKTSTAGVIPSKRPPIRSGPTHSNLPSSSSSSSSTANRTGNGRDKVGSTSRTGPSVRPALSRTTSGSSSTSSSSSSSSTSTSSIRSTLSRPTTSTGHARTTGTSATLGKKATATRSRSANGDERGLVVANGRTLASVDRRVGALRTRDGTTLPPRPSSSLASATTVRKSRSPPRPATRASIRTITATANGDYGDEEEYEGEEGEDGLDGMGVRGGYRGFSEDDEGDYGGDPRVRGTARALANGTSRRGPPPSAGPRHMGKSATGGVTSHGRAMSPPNRRGGPPPNPRTVSSSPPAPRARISALGRTLSSSPPLNRVQVHGAGGSRGMVHSLTNSSMRPLSPGTLPSGQRARAGLPGRRPVSASSVNRPSSPAHSLSPSPSRGIRSGSVTPQRMGSPLPLIPGKLGLHPKLPAPLTQRRPSSSLGTRRLPLVEQLRHGDWHVRLEGLLELAIMVSAEGSSFDALVSAKALPPPDILSPVLLGLYTDPHEEVIEEVCVAENVEVVTQVLSLEHILIRILALYLPEELEGKKSTGNGMRRRLMGSDFPGSLPPSPSPCPSPASASSSCSSSSSSLENTSVLGMVPSAAATATLRRLRVNLCDSTIAPALCKALVNSGTGSSLVGGMSGTARRKVLLGVVRWMGELTDRAVSSDLGDHLRDAKLYFEEPAHLKLYLTRLFPLLATTAEGSAVYGPLVDVVANLRCCHEDIFEQVLYSFDEAVVQRVCEAVGLIEEEGEEGTGRDLEGDVWMGDGPKPVKTDPSHPSCTDGSRDVDMGSEAVDSASSSHGGGGGGGIVSPPLSGESLEKQGHQTFSTASTPVEEMMESLQTGKAGRMEFRRCLRLARDTSVSTHPKEAEESWGVDGETFYPFITALLAYMAQAILPPVGGQRVPEEGKEYALSLVRQFLETQTEYVMLHAQDVLSTLIAYRGLKDSSVSAMADETLMVFTERLDKAVVLSTTLDLLTTLIHDPHPHTSLNGMMAAAAAASAQDASSLCSPISPNSLTSHLPPDASSVLPCIFSSLALLLERYRLASPDEDPMTDSDLERIASLSTDGFNHHEPETRKTAVETLVALYDVVGDGMWGFLEDLTAPQTKLLEAFLNKARD